MDIDVAGSTLSVDRATAHDLQLLDSLVGRFAPAGRSFLALPFWPGAYPAFGRKSPVWEIYSLFPRSEAFQRAEITRIEAADPGFVIVFDFPLDGREDLRYRNTHPLIHGYLREHFEPINGYTANQAYEVFTSNGAVR